MRRLMLLLNVSIQYKATGSSLKKLDIIVH